MICDDVKIRYQLIDDGRVHLVGTSYADRDVPKEVVSPLFR